MPMIREETINQSDLSMASVIDPALNAAVATTIIDSYSGVIITLTGAGNAQTLQDPTNITAGEKVFTVVANDSNGANTIEVNGITLSAGEAQRFVWDGSAWIAITAIDADDIFFTPTGDLVATNVQSAIAEVDTEKVKRITSVDNEIARFYSTKGDIQGYTSKAPTIDDGGKADFTGGFGGDNLFLDHNVETLAANKTLVITDKVIQKLDPDGTDRDVLLPAENTATDLVFFIYNMGGELGEDLNIQDDAAAALETIHYGHMGICTCDGTIWTVRCLSCADAIDVLSLRVKEENTSALVIGQPVYTSGASGVAFPTVGLADCGDANKIEVVGLVAEAISKNKTGYARVHGLLEAVNSTKGGSINPGSEDWVAGDQLYLSAAVGGLTNIRPTSGRIVKVGIALTVEGPNSKILVDIHRNPIWTTAASGEDIIQRMGDSAGANKISYRDYANNEVASLDSDGNAIFTVLQGKYQDGDDKTDTYNITSADFGKSLRMNSANDKIFNLPSVSAFDDGARVTIEKLGAGKVTIDAADSDKIADSGAGDTIYNNIAAEIYASITLEYIHAIVTWVIIGGFGTWTSTD